MAETTTHTEAPAGHTKFPPFDTEYFPSQLVWLTISFVLLYVLISRIALPRIGGIMAARSKVISDDLAAAEQLKDQSNAVQAAYEKVLADARSRGQAITSVTREQQARETEDQHKRLDTQLHERIASRRLMGSSPRPRATIYHVVDGTRRSCASQQNLALDSAWGQKQTLSGVSAMSALRTPPCLV